MAPSCSATTKARALDDVLRRLFRSVEARALPQSLKVVLDQLDDHRMESAADSGR